MLRTLFTQGLCSQIWIEIFLLHYETGIKEQWTKNKTEENLTTVLKFCVPFKHFWQYYNI